MATYDIATQTVDPSQLNIGDILNCSYSGSMKSITLPIGKYELEVWGAEGGYRSSATYSGKGGYSVGTLTLEQSTRFYVYSGGSGNTGKTNGGFNGGGKRSTYNGGGGASDIRLGQNSLYARVIVAGGGGSDGATSKKGMYGGGTAGGDATENYGTLGYGGTQTGSSGGSQYVSSTQSSSTTNQSDAYCGFGFGGNGITRSSGYGGAGGAGWYGGCGAYPDSSSDDDRGGGGGSGYVYTSSTAKNYPSGCLLNSSMYLENASTTAGDTSFTSPTGTSETGHTGNGYCRITIIRIGSHIPVSYDIDDITDRTRLYPNDVINCDYSGSIKSISLPKGKYKLEVWGAQGGNGTTNKYLGGLGGYTVGTYTAADDITLYLGSGQQGKTGTSTSSSSITFNGGGAGYYSSNSKGAGSGGGASHIALANGIISTIADKTKLLVIAGGGGGGYTYGSTEDNGTGGYGGGNTGGNGTSVYSDPVIGRGGSQTSGGRGSQAGSYGTGASSTTSYGGGGGGGLYGGGSGEWAGGGGGSGYTNTSSLTNYSTSNGSQTFISPSGTSETGHSGNGYCRITILDIWVPQGGVRINHTWKEIEDVLVYVNNQWKMAYDLQVGIGNTWKNT